MSPSFLDFFFSDSQPRSEKETNVKFKQLQYLLVKVLPILKDIYMEQNRELEIEATIRGGGSLSSLVPSSYFFLFLFSTHEPVLF